MSISSKEQEEIENFLWYEKENIIRFKSVLLDYIRKYNNAMNKSLILMTLKEVFFINGTFICSWKVSAFESPRMKQFIYGEL